MDKNQALIKLYSQCLENNFTDMTNEKHQLKAKVFATDLGLKYKKIETLFTEAKAAYEQHQIELERSAQAAKEKADLAQKREHLQKNAKLAFTAKGYHYGELKIYRCKDGSVFCKADDEDEKYTNIEITVEAGQLYFYKYHPSKTVYTGASAGGIAMGGFHTTEAHYTQRKTSTEKGSVVIRYGKKSLDVGSVTLAPDIAILFRRVPEYKANFSKNTAICRKNNKDSDKLLTMSMYARDQGTQMEIASHAADETKIPFSKCEEIADILNNIIHNKFPVQDEEIYTKAMELSEKNDVEHLGKAIELFEYIKDYKDSKKHLAKIRPVYDAIIQEQKEQNIIQKEKKQRKRKILTIITVPLVLVFLVISYMSLDSLAKYNRAVNNMQSGNYDAAISVFAELNDYKDSKTLLAESEYLKRENTYQKCINKLENNLDSNSETISDLITDLKSLGNYKNSEDIVAELELFEEIINETTITKEVAKKAKKIVYESKYIKTSEKFKGQVYAYYHLFNVDWEYSAGDPYAISMALKDRRDLSNITTRFRDRSSWDTTNLLNVWTNNEIILTIGRSDLGDSEHSIKYKEDSIIYQGTQIILIDQSFSRFECSAVFDGKNDTLTITIDMNDGNSYSCTYVKVQ